MGSGRGGEVGVEEGSLWAGGPCGKRLLPTGLFHPGIKGYSISQIGDPEAEKG